MSIRKQLLLVAGIAVFMASSVMAVPHAEAEGAQAEPAVAAEAADEAEEEAAPEPEPVAAPEPQPEVEPVAVQEVALVAIAPAAEVKPASKLEVTPYGAASYRYRGRIWMADGTVTSYVPDTVKKDASSSTFDQLSMLSWYVGLKAKVDEKLSLQFQIGNDWTAGEGVSWSMKNTPAGRYKDNNLYVHLAYAKWNPGCIYIDAGVIPLNSNGTLDLLERSLNTGSYNEAVYQGWPAQTNNSLAAFRLGAPILKNDFKLAAEAVVSTIDLRTQKLSVTEDALSNPASLLLMLNLPIAAGALKVTPEFTALLNRNYNSALEKGDHEILFGLSSSYKLDDAITLSLSGGYGMIDNENSKVGSYGSKTDFPQLRAPDKDRGDDYKAYKSVGMQVGVGTNIKVGPGAFAFDLKYGNSSNDEDKTSSIDNIYIDPRYTWNVHPKFTIMPRCRVYISTYDESKEIKTKTEIRPELVIGGSF